MSTNPIQSFGLVTSIKVQALPCTHLTSMSVDFNWQTGSSFTPIDAIAQWIKQGIHRDNDTLEQVLLRWLSHHQSAKSAIAKI